MRKICGVHAITQGTVKSIHGRLGGVVSGGHSFVGLQPATLIPTVTLGKLFASCQDARTGLN